MRVTTKIGIDLQRPSYPTVINAVQGDQNTRQLEISLYSGSVAWQIPENTVVAMRYCKPDRTKGYYDTMPDGSTAFTVSENMVSILLAPQILTVAGTVSAQVVLYQGTAVLSTFSVQIRVEADPSAGAVTSEDYVNWMQWIKSELDAYLEQLKNNGEFVGGTAVGDIDMNGHALSGLREPVRDDEAATKGYVAEIIQSGTGAVSTVAGVSPDADGNVPLTASDVTALPIGGGDMEGPVNMSGQKLSGLNAPTADDEAATKGYVDDEIAKIDVSSQISGKVDKANVVNNFSTTEEGFVADARALQVLNDKFTAVEFQQINVFNKNNVLTYALIFHKIGRFVHIVIAPQNVAISPAEVMATKLPTKYLPVYEIFPVTINITGGDKVGHFVIGPDGSISVYSPDANMAGTSMYISRWE